MKLELEATYNPADNRVEVTLNGLTVLLLPCVCVVELTGEEHAIKYSIEDWLKTVEEMRVADQPRRDEDDRKRQEQWWDS